MPPTPPPGSAAPRSCPAPAALPPGLNRFRRPKTEVPVKRKELRPCRMLARPLTASKRKAGLSEESVLELRESGLRFAFAATTDDGLRVGKEVTPSMRQKTRQRESFILGGCLGGIASLPCKWEEDVANIHTSYMQDFNCWKLYFSRKLYWKHHLIICCLTFILILN